MKTTTKNIFDLHKKGHFIAITTNGNLNSKGDCVMGKGIAKEAATRFPWMPHNVGLGLKAYGNYPLCFFQEKLFTFPTKNNWWEKSDLELIKKSMRMIAKKMIAHKIEKLYIPKPGCSNGQLEWVVVKRAISPIIKKYNVNVVVCVE